MHLLQDFQKTLCNLNLMSRNEGGQETLFSWELETLAGDSFKCSKGHQNVHNL